MTEAAAVSHGVGPPESDRWIKVLAGCMAAMALILIALAARVNPDWVWSNIVQTTTSALAVLVATPLAVYGRAKPGILVAIGCWIWFAGDLTGMALASLDLIDTHHRVIEVIYLVGQVFWMLSSLAAIERPQRRSAMWRSADGLLSALLFVFMLLTFVGAFASDRGGDNWYAVVTIAVDGAYVALAVLAVRGISRSHKPAYAMMALSAVVLLSVDMVSLYALLADAPFSSRIFDLGWSLQSMIRAIGLLMVASHVKRGSIPEEVVLRPSRVVIPLVVGAVGAVVIVEPVSEWDPMRKVLLGAMVVAIAVREVLSWFVIRDLEESELAATRDLQRRVRHDDLTGLLRRDCLFEELTIMIDDARKSGDFVSVAYIDLDEFSVINDSFGHDVGDRALVEVAERLRSSGAQLIGRMGGDEFVLAHRQVEESAWLRARLLEALLNPIGMPNGAAVRISASVGVVTVRPEESTTPEDLVSEADRASYTVKRGTVRSRSVKHLQVEQLATLPDLAEALKALHENRIVLNFAPLIDLESGLIAGVEATVRVEPAPGDNRETESFLALLQAAGYSADVTVALLRQALPEFAQRPAECADWFLTFQLAAADVADHRTMDLLRELISSTGIPATQIVVVLGPCLDLGFPLPNAVDALSSVGVHFALNGLGSDAPTFSQVARLAPALLKLDVGAIPLADPDPILSQHSARLVESFVQLTRRPESAVVAQGVKSSEQRDIVRELGCQFAQGPLWSDVERLHELGDRLAG